MFKKIVFALLLALPMSLFAQKFGVVDIEAVLSAMPETKAMQTQLTDTSKKYEEEFQKLQEEVNKLYADFQNIQNDTETPQSIKERRMQEIQDKAAKVDPSQKRELGQALNELKTYATERINTLREAAERGNDKGGDLDLTRTAAPLRIGTRHPLSLVREQIIDIFRRLGFTIAEGPEIEDDWHVFESLNFPPDHPARDMQDTFFINRTPDVLLRTHTSSVQTRVMTSQKPPIRIICPGRVYRNEAISARAHCFFHQVEALYVDKNVTYSDLRQTLLYFAREMFGPQTQIRLRPSYFPFTEPSAEMDISCNLCGGKGCSFCKGTGWVEILGCGMVDPAVLDACGIDSKEYTGFALGMGIERITNLKYQVKDLRLFSENDHRFLDEFVAAH